MPIHFKPLVASAVNREYGITIFRPRIEPISESRIELQYAVRLQGARHGLSVFADVVECAPPDNCSESWRLEIDECTIDDIAEMHRKAGCAESLAQFLAGFAQGLVAPYTTGWGLACPFYLDVVISVELLRKSRIELDDCKNELCAFISLARLHIVPSALDGLE